MKNWSPKYKIESRLVYSTRKKLAFLVFFSTLSLSKVSAAYLQYLRRYCCLKLTMYIWSLYPIFIEILLFWFYNVHMESVSTWNVWDFTNHILTGWLSRSLDLVCLLVLYKLSSGAKKTGKLVIFECSFKFQSFSPLSLIFKEIGLFKVWNVQMESLDLCFSTPFIQVWAHTHRFAIQISGSRF